MSLNDLDKLLEKISEESPAGEDLSYDEEFNQLTLSAQRKPAVVQDGNVVRAAEEPHWSQVASSAENLLARSKDLAVVEILTRAWTATEGFIGLCDGLELIHRLIGDEWWDAVYPRIEDGDVDFRVSALQQLSDPKALTRMVTLAPLVRGCRPLEAVGLRDLQMARGEKTPTPEDRPAPDQSVVDQAFQQCELETLQASFEAINHCVETYDAIRRLFEEKTDRRLEALEDGVPTLSGALAAVASEIGARWEERGGAVVDSESGATSGAVESESAGSSSAAAPPAGTISSREDVLRMIDKICEYYQRAEPASPVPLLLKRARQLVTMDFREIVKNLASDGLAQVENICGVDSGD